MSEVINWITSLLCAVGAINWGLNRFFGVNIIEYVLGLDDRFFVKTATYFLITISGVYTLLRLFSV